MHLQGADESEEEEEGEDEEEMEPVLKYERIGNAISGIFAKDAASCMAVHSKVFSFCIYCKQ